MSWHQEFGQEVLVRGARGFIYCIKADQKPWIGSWGVSDRIIGAASRLAEFDTEYDAVQWLRLWRLMQGLNEDGTPAKT